MSHLYTQALSVFIMLKNGPSLSTFSKGIPTLSPSTFTIAELIRLARLTKNTDLAYDVILWGLSRSTFIPIAVISDAMSLLYENGASSLVFQLYQHLYQYKVLNHWMDGLETFACSIDVHGYNQGMTYAAVTSAVKEVVLQLYQCAIPLLSAIYRLSSYLVEIQHLQSSLRDSRLLPEQILLAIRLHQWRLLSCPLKSKEHSWKISYHQYLPAR